MASGPRTGGIVGFDHVSGWGEIEDKATMMVARRRKVVSAVIEGLKDNLRCWEGLDVSAARMAEVFVNTSATSRMGRLLKDILAEEAKGRENFQGAQDRLKGMIQVLEMYLKSLGEVDAWRQETEISVAEYMTRTRKGWSAFGRARRDETVTEVTKEQLQMRQRCVIRGFEQLELAIARLLEQTMMGFILSTLELTDASPFRSFPSEVKSLLPMEAPDASSVLIDEIRRQIEAIEAGEDPDSGFMSERPDPAGANATPSPRLPLTPYPAAEPRSVVNPATYHSPITDQDKTSAVDKFAERLRYSSMFVVPRDAPPVSRKEVDKASEQPIRDESDRSSHNPTSAGVGRREMPEELVLDERPDFIQSPFPRPDSSWVAEIYRDREGSDNFSTPTLDLSDSDHFASPRVATTHPLQNSPTSTEPNTTPGMEATVAPPTDPKRVSTGSIFKLMKQQGTKPQDIHTPDTPGRSEVGSWPRPPNLDSNTLANENDPAAPRIRLPSGIASTAVLGDALFLESVSNVDPHALPRGNEYDSYGRVMPEPGNSPMPRGVGRTDADQLGTAGGPPHIGVGGLDNSGFSTDTISNIDPHAVPPPQMKPGPGAGLGRHPSADPGSNFEAREMQRQMDEAGQPQFYKDLPGETTLGPRSGFSRKEGQYSPVEEERRAAFPAALPRYASESSDAPGDSNSSTMSNTETGRNAHHTSSHGTVSGIPLVDPHSLTPDQMVLQTEGTRKMQDAWI